MKGGGGNTPASNSGKPFRASLVHMAGLALLDAFALYIFYSVATMGTVAAAVGVAIVTLLLNWIFISDKLYPIRWLSPGLVLIVMMVIYPLFYNMYISTTNYSDGHLLSKQQVLDQLNQRYYQPENAANYKLTVYRADDGRFLLYLVDQDGRTFTGTPEDGLRPLQSSEKPPAEIGPYKKLETMQTFQYLTQLQNVEIPAGEFKVRVTAPDKAQKAIRRYAYDPTADTLTDKETGVIYKPVDGNFVDAQGNVLDAPGFTSSIGLLNFKRVFSDPQIQAPFLRVFLWTVTFAFLTVLLTFSAGLILALVMNDKDLPLRALFRSLAIIPYEIPGFISILVWVGLLNPYYGPFSLMIQHVFGFSPDWFANGTQTKIAILMINTWLGFPYMMLISLGALQSIQTEMYEAAELDGAGRIARFRYLTLPLLLVSIGPMLIGVFAFNFNNFTVIDLVNQGGPPMIGAATPAGQTDILISYTYRLAFASGRGADFGLASTIALFIFFIVALITLFNFRFTRQLEDVMR